MCCGDGSPIENSAPISSMNATRLMFKGISFNDWKNWASLSNYTRRHSFQPKPTALHALTGSVSPRRRQIFIGDPFCDTERPPPADSPRFYISYILSIDPHVTRTR